MDRALSEPNPSSGFSTWVLKSARFFKIKARVKSRVCRKRFEFDGMVVNNSVYRASPNHPVARMEGVKIRVLNKEESEESSSSSDLLASEVTLNCENSSEGSSSSPSLEWATHKDKLPRCHSFAASEEVEKPSRNLERQGSCILSETEMMKERFSKLLLGEDMSGCGNGVCAALAISNAVTNLYATLFGQVWRLEPLQRDKKSMWRREMQCILCINDHIVELIPTWQTFPDGSKLEVMTSRPRSDLYINLPALRKLDNMLLDVLDSFENSEFWYVDQGVLAPETDGSSSFRNPLPRQQEKWWLPVPQVPPGGLTQDTRKMLQHMRDCTSQILKAAKAINASVLAEMKIPNPYLEALPKNGKSSLGDLIYRYINSEQFSPECLLDCLDLSSEHHALEIANRVEAAVHVWRRRMSSKPSLGALRSSSRSSWELVKDLVSDGDKRELLADRAESLLLCLKQRFPGLTQTTLDTAKIQYNKDVGKSILESYSRVLESLAFNIVVRIDDLIYVDDLSMHSDQVVSISKVGVAKVESAVTPYKTASTTPSFSPSLFISPAKGDRSSPYLENYRQSLTGTGLSSTKRIFTDQQPSRVGKGISFMSRLDSFSSKTTPSSPSLDSSRGSTSLSMHESVQDG